MSTRAVTLQTFDRDVLASERPVLVDFWAPWCGPCHAVAPVLDRIVAERAGELELVKVNIDEEPELAARFGISSIPTIVLFEGGRPVAGAVGARGKAQLEKALGLARDGAVPAPPEARGLRTFFSRLARRGT